MPKTIPATLVAKATIICAQQKLWFEIHDTASFSRFFLGYKAIKGVKGKINLLPYWRGRAKDLENLVQQEVENIKRIGNDTVIRTRINVYREDAYVQLLQRQSAAANKSRPDVHIPTAGYTSLQKKMDIITGRKRRF